MLVRKEQTEDKLFVIKK